MRRTLDPHKPVKGPCSCGHAMVNHYIAEDFPYDVTCSADNCTGWQQCDIEFKNPITEPQ